MVAQEAGGPMRVSAYPIAGIGAGGMETGSLRAQNERIAARS